MKKTTTCSKAFMESSQLIEHERTHTAEKYWNVLSVGMCLVWGKVMLSVFTFFPTKEVILEGNHINAMTVGNSASTSSCLTSSDTYWSEL